MILLLKAAPKTPIPGRVIKEAGRDKILEDLDDLIAEHEHLIGVLGRDPAPEAQAMATAEGKELDSLKGKKAQAMTKSGPHPVSAGWTPPTEAQAKAGNYRKPKIEWRGLTIAVECPAGTYRSGTDRDGNSWSVRMLYPYGYVMNSLGVDGDAFDVYMGPNPEAAMVYVITTRVPGRWDQDDEQKAMLGFESEEDARQAFLKHYNDPRFLGAVLAMPAADFVARVQTTKGNPHLMKSVPVVFLRRA